jgi:hypothetical protein
MTMSICTLLEKRTCKVWLFSIYIHHSQCTQAEKPQELAKLLRHSTRQNPTGTGTTAAKTKPHGKQAPVSIDDNIEDPEDDSGSEYAKSSTGEVDDNEHGNKPEDEDEPEEEEELELGQMVST